MKLTQAILLSASLSFSLMTQAASKLVKVPTLFENGPATVMDIKLASDEMASLMLLESVMDIASSAVLATGCQSVEGNYSIETAADGVISRPETNIARITSPENPEPLILNATIEAPVDFFGQNFTIRQTKNNKLKETLISEYSANVTVNHELTLLSMHSNTNAQSQNNKLIPYQNLLIKHFYGEQKESPNQYMQGWGSASLSIAGYPANLAWIRFKALKTDGRLKHLVLQADRLIGASVCRILLDSATEIQNDNNKESHKNLVFKGNMAITKPQSYEDNANTFEF